MFENVEKRLLKVGQIQQVLAPTLSGVSVGWAAAGASFPLQKEKHLAEFRRLWLLAFHDVLDLSDIVTPQTGFGS